MNLLFDLGNTRCKWALEEEGAFSESGIVRYRDLHSLAAVCRSHHRIEKVLISSVVADERNQELTRWVVKHVGVTPKFAKVVKQFAGVTVAYDNVDNLGVDRWLAMLGAWKTLERSCVVVDAGSAITVDYLAANGTHLGGLIVPGFGMMRHALLEKTNAVNVNALTLPRAWQPGCDTLPCVANGLSALLKGFLAEVITKYEARPKVLLAGGDARLLGAALAIEAEVREHLILEGLICLS